MLRKIIGGLIAVAALSAGLLTVSPTQAEALLGGGNYWDAGSRCDTYYPGSPVVAPNQYKVQDCWFNKYRLKVHIRMDFYTDGMRHHNTDMYWDNVLMEGGANHHGWSSDQIMLMVNWRFQNNPGQRWLVMTFCSAYDGVYDLDPQHYRTDQNIPWHDVVGVNGWGGDSGGGSTIYGGDWSILGDPWLNGDTRGYGLYQVPGWWAADGAGGRYVGPLYVNGYDWDDAGPTCNAENRYIFQYGTGL